MTGPLVSALSAQQLVGGSTTQTAVAQPGARKYAGTRPFAAFGHWGETVRVVRAGAEPMLIRWLALRRQRGTSYEQLWDACQAALPECFLEYRIVNMRRPSFFLPAGEVVFKVMVNPTQIPDSPPLGVSLRHIEALDAFPRATFYFLRPVFTADPCARLYTAADLRLEAETDRDNIVAAARVHGWAIRTAARARRGLLAAAGVGLRTATRVTDALYLLSVPIERRMLARMARRAEQLREDQGLASLAARADELGLAREAQEFRRAALRLQATFDFDPILCFEVAHRPGELWFESHWYHGQDGRLYVHY